MGEVTLPWSIITAIGTVVVAAVTALWADAIYWRKKWASEVKRNSLVLRSTRRMIERQHGIESTPPESDDDENTQVRRMMLDADIQWLEEYKRREVDDELETFLSDMADTPRETPFGKSKNKKR